MTQKPLLQIEGLYIEFHTEAGVVKAMDGIDLEIGEGETIGLVGESGCGKSVTANSIMGLIPIPPGKISGGKIFFHLIDKNIIERMKKSSRSRGDKNDHNDIDNGFDILSLNKKQLRLIRGKTISMIFQEPMSALNPVLTIGDQISEIVLLHEKKELSTQILSDIQLEKQAAVNMKKIERIPTEKGGYACNGCGAAIQVEQSTCPNCGENIKLRRSYLRNVRLAYDSKFFKMIQENPDSLAIKVCDRIPLVGSYQKRMKQAALNTSIRMLRLVRIPDPQNIVKSFPFELSGGMQQRVMIAMALACKPKLLIADEPTTALDVTIQAQILKLMRELQDEMGTSLLLITHNLGIVAEMCDRIGIMYAGNIVEIAGKNSIFKEPLHPYTQGLMNSIPNVAVQLTRLETIQGNVPNLIKPPSGCRFHTRCPYVMEYCKLNKPENKEVRPGHLVACHLYNGGGSSG